MDKVLLRINKLVSLATATAIMELLSRNHTGQMAHSSST
jgi:hypothetical protein